MCSPRRTDCCQPTLFMNISAAIVDPLPDGPSADGLAPRPLTVLHEHASGPQGSVRRFHNAAQRFRDEPSRIMWAKTTDITILYQASPMRCNLRPVKHAMKGGRGSTEEAERRGPRNGGLRHFFAVRCWIASLTLNLSRPTHYFESDPAERDGDILSSSSDCRSRV